MDGLCFVKFLLVQFVFFFWDMFGNENEKMEGDGLYIAPLPTHPNIDLEEEKNAIYGIRWM